jgi:hypothetical protein
LPIEITMPQWHSLNLDFQLSTFNFQLPTHALDFQLSTFNFQLPTHA